eukprot:CAMPEP_0169131144 /NCGR_PEP_ID=MMETSP1015-20121227/38093_1 /TAXON_ID=342587 /ORGANISM="Karlodinium micrum, Strain CCMP2283" /LENGTH=408 /DNA_ID=CAMNT_0009195391 /DNA_START=40 /DNA_END=1262 /DNA_ORIENTATION=-
MHAASRECRARNSSAPGNYSIQQAPISARAALQKGNSRASPIGDTSRNVAGIQSAEKIVKGSRSASANFSSAVDSRPPLERLLDRRLQSVSTFVSSTQSAWANGDPVYSKGAMSSQWSEEMPNVILFPTNKPSSRADAVVLDQWVTTSLARYAQKMANTKEGPGDLPRMVDELVPILSIGLHEVVRQVTHHCLERGVVLEKIWRTYVELFERALAETRALLRYHKARTQRVDTELVRTAGELTDIQQRHPEQIEKLSKTLANKFTQRQEELEDQLKTVRHENNVLMQHLAEHSNNVKAWFPLFDYYKHSSYRATLQNTGAAMPSATTPEARIAADFKRILTAMPVDGRRRVGFFVSSLLGLRGSELVENPETLESLTERREHNTWKIDMLNQRIKELRGESPRKLETP